MDIKEHNYILYNYDKAFQLDNKGINKMLFDYDMDDEELVQYLAENNSHALRFSVRASEAKYFSSRSFDSMAYAIEKYQGKIPNNILAIYINEYGKFFYNVTNSQLKGAKAFDMPWIMNDALGQIKTISIPEANLSGNLKSKKNVRHYNAICYNNTCIDSQRKGQSINIDCTEFKAISDWMKPYLSRSSYTYSKLIGNDSIYDVFGHRICVIGKMNRYSITLTSTQICCDVISRLRHRVDARLDNNGFIIKQ